MTKLAYLECPTGIAGDMCLGALVHAGVPLDYLIEKLKLLCISNEYELRAEQVHRNGQLATKVYVDLVDKLTKGESDRSHHHHHHEDGEMGGWGEKGMGGLGDGETRREKGTGREGDGGTRGLGDGETRGENLSNHQLPISNPKSKIQNPKSRVRYLPEIEHLIKAAKLPPRAAEWSLGVFRQLAVAEGAVHGISPEKVHFHEVGATDAIVDIVGTCLGLDWLGVEKLYCSAMPTGGGTVWAAHGRLAVPVPAVLKLWEMRQVPVYSNGIDRELVTPTGAAIACTLCTKFGSPPTMTIQSIGLGAGSHDLPIPNILRLWIGEVEETKEELVTNYRSPVLETITVLETQIDDLSPQAIGYLFDALFNAGAVDVFTQPIGMKKSRPGILLTVICHPENLTACESLIFRETTTLGIRRYTQQRSILEREIQHVQTDYGLVRVKVAWNGSDCEQKITNIQPEYEDCAQIAREHNLPWREIHQITLQKWYLQNNKNQSV